MLPLAQPVQLALKDFKVLPDPLEQSEKQENKDRRDLKDHKDLLDLLAMVEDRAVVLLRNILQESW
jgi:hypothetical protein